MQKIIDGAIWSRCEICGEWFHETDGIAIDRTCARVLEGTDKQFHYCSPEHAAEDGWLAGRSGNWNRRKYFEAWSQDVFSYRGTHGMNEVIAEITVEDVLWAMYTVNVELTDRNLEELLSELNSTLFAEFHDRLADYVDKTAQECCLSRKER